MIYINIYLLTFCNQSLSITHNYRIDLKQPHLSLNKFVFNTLLSILKELNLNHWNIAASATATQSLWLCALQADRR